ncbi:uncharacterized protein LOC108138607 [Drosophila elegans]|uniref:uncharacterized protein LOC108138607 n=1 Tax=Drosophila elegans TaxID=30023 RepID=UPI001BC84A53|nr:uncharacterized protein LOC108138607 [Drosophila elegans]
MQLFLYLMTTSISLVLIVENDGTPLMSLLDGTFLESHNYSTESPEGRLSSYPLGNAKVRSTSTIIPNRLSKMLSQKNDNKVNREIADREERKRIESLWDPVLNQSYDFSRFEGHENTSIRISKKFTRKDQENIQKIEDEEEQRIQNLWNPALNETYVSSIVGNDDNESENDKIKMVDAKKKSFNCDDSTSNMSLPCITPSANTLEEGNSVKNESLAERSRRRRYPLKARIYIIPKLNYGQIYSIFTTIPSLGKENFVLKITVDTKDYLIDEVDTAVDIAFSGWNKTTNLRGLLKKNGIVIKHLLYNRCYYYRSTASFFNINHRYVIAKISSMEDSKKQLSRAVRRKIKVHRPPKVACLPALKLEFCKNPDEPVEISPWGHREFFATISESCPTVEYKFISWNFYDITEKNLIARIQGTTDLVVKLLPYKVEFLYEPDTTKVFLLQGKVKLNDVLTVARCYAIYKTPQVEPQIRGNEQRKVDVRKPVIIDGSLSKDRIKNKESLATKHFFWSCRSRNDPDNKYCYRDMSENPVVKLPANALKAGGEYNFSLTVISKIDFRNRKTVTQRVRGISEQTVTLQIECRRNCDLGVYAPLESVHLVPVCEDCPSKIRRYEWWVLVEGEMPYLESRYKYLILRIVEPIVSIRLRVVMDKRLTADAFYTLRRNYGPDKGTCHISPSFGVEAKSIFEIACLGFESPYSPVTFRYKVKLGVLASNVPYTRFKLTLPATNKIMVSICDNIDMCVDRVLKVKVLATRNDFGTHSTSLIDTILGEVPNMLLRGHWHRAYVKGLVATRWIRTTKNGQQVYSYFQNEKARTGSQLEQITNLATRILTRLTPVDYHGATLMGVIFNKLCEIFEDIINENEWLHRDAYFSLTAMHMFFMSILGKKSEQHSVAMCKPHISECLNVKKFDLEKHFTIVFDPLILLRINSWMANTWFLYKCVFFLGVLATHRHYPYDDALTVHQGGIAYQVNVTEVTNHAKGFTLATIDKIHVIEFSAKLLHELKSSLKHSSILFQTISQQNHHNIFWWYPDPLPTKTSVLIVHAYSPVKYFRTAEESELSNPLVYKTNITQFNEELSFTQRMVNGSIENVTEIHIYSMMLDNKAMLAVRIVGCSEPMHIKMQMHRWPTFRDLRHGCCHIHPEMKGKRIWMANSCGRSRAFVSIHRPSKKKRKKNKYLRNARHREPSIRAKQMNYSILLEIFACNFWKNRSLDPGWSEDYCTTTFEHSYGTSVQCTCHTLGTLSSRILPISAELFVEHIPVPILLFNALVLILFVLLFLLLIIMMLFNIGFVTAYRREQSILQCQSAKKVEKVDQWITHGSEILLVIITGGQEFAGTTSNIKFYFKSPQRQQMTYQIAQDPGHPKLLRNSTNMLMVPRGTIYIPTRLALGIERNGRYPSWYCRSVTVVDLDSNFQQLFLVKSWIERGHTPFMRSKYFTKGSYRKTPKYSWCKRLRNRAEQLFVSWFIINPITGPWQSSVGGFTLNRFQRTSVWICKLAITVTVICVYFGKSTVETIQEDKRLNIQDHIRISAVAALAFYAFVIGLFIHFLFEGLILRWLFP